MIMFFQLFLALLWGTLVIGTLAGGILFAYFYALKTDQDDVAFRVALRGLAWRILLTLVMLSFEITTPLQFLGVTN